MESSTLRSSVWTKML